MIASACASAARSTRWQPSCPMRISFSAVSFASEPELSAALALLPRLARPPRRVLKVETYNGAAALASPAVPWLDAAGFVRDHPGMAYYAGWH